MRGERATADCKHSVPSRCPPLQIGFADGRGNMKAEMKLPQSGLCRRRRRTGRPRRYRYDHVWSALSGLALCPPENTARQQDGNMMKPTAGSK